MSDTLSNTPDGVLLGVDPPAVQSLPTSLQTFTPPGFSAEDIAKARQQEKDKLYPQLERLQSEVARLSKEREEREAEEQRRREEAEAATRAKNESEMDVRSLLKQREEEWNGQLQALRLERERDQALLERERAYNELQTYRTQRVEQVREDIIPELLDLVDGATPEEIESSIAGLAERSARIIESAQQAAQAARAQMPGSRVTAPPVGPLENQSGQQTLTAEDIAAMSMSDYARNRDRLLGHASAQRNRGLFG